MSHVYRPDAFRNVPRLLNPALQPPGGGGGTSARVTQVAVEAVVKRTPNEQVTQVAIEVLVHKSNPAQSTQVVIEVLTPFGTGVQPLVFAIT